jgi:hypothetical protein
MHTRTTGAIATKPTDKAQCGHWFYSLTTGQMLDRRRWTPLPMSSDVIERIDILVKAIQAGMNFSNMWNELYDDEEDDDSDTDSEYNSDDSSSDHDDDADDNYENNNDGLSADQDVDEALDDVSLSEENVKKEVPTRLKKLTDDTGALPPIIQSRTWQQAKETGESLMTGAEAIKTVTKKQRKFRKELQIRLLKGEEEENKKKLRNKLRNEKKIKNQERKGDFTQLGCTSANGNRKRGQ